MAAEYYTQKLEVTTPANPRRSIIVDNAEGNLKIIPLSSVYYFKSKDKSVLVKTQEGEFLINKTLNAIENVVGNDFIRVHRNALISMDHLDGLDKNAEGRWCVRFKGIEENMEVSRRNTPIVLRWLREGFC